MIDWWNDVDVRWVHSVILDCNLCFSICLIRLYFTHIWEDRKIVIHSILDISEELIVVRAIWTCGKFLNNASSRRRGLARSAYRNEIKMSGKMPFTRNNMICGASGRYGNATRLVLTKYWLIKNYYMMSSHFAIWNWNIPDRLASICWRLDWRRI